MPSRSVSGHHRVAEKRGEKCDLKVRYLPPWEVNLRAVLETASGATEVGCAMNSEHETTTLSSIPDELLYAAILEPLSVLELRVAACTCIRWRDAIPAQSRLFSCIVTSAGSNEVMLFDARGRLTASFRALPPPKRRGSGS